MDRRLGTLLALSADTQDGGDSGTDVTMDEGAAGAEERLPPGWRKLSTRDGWRPSPIGVYVHCT